MALALIGKKCGMMQSFQENGVVIPVTVIEIIENRISQIKSVKSDGYDSVQIAYGKKKSSKVNKPLSGHCAKAKIDGFLGSFECRCSDLEIVNFKLGDALSIDLFKEGQKIDVSGISKGKGFAGTIKRHNFSMQDATHGNSLSHRAPGSIGQNQTPGRVFKGKKMAGQMGNKSCTIQNLGVVKIDQDKNLVFVRGSVPGATGGYVMIKPAVKHSIAE